MLKKINLSIISFFVISFGVFCFFDNVQALVCTNTIGGVTTCVLPVGGSCIAGGDDTTADTCEQWNAEHSVAPTETADPSTSGGTTQPPLTEVKLVNPLGGTDENVTGQVVITAIVARIIQTALGVMGSVALLVFVYGAYNWIIAGGSEEKVKTGMNAILYATIGIFIIFASYAILSSVLGIFG